MSNSRRVFAGALALVVAGAVTVTAQTDRTDSRTFDFRPGDLLEIDTDRGHIELRTGASSGVTVMVRAKGGQVADYLDLSFEETASGLRIIGEKTRGRDSRSRRRDSGSIEFVIDAPERMDLNLRTGGGHIEMDTIDGAVSLSTGGGHISFRDIRGSFEARTGGGHIEGGKLYDGGSIRTGGGHISIEEADHDIDVETGGGHISLGNVMGQVEARTSGGHISLGEVDGGLNVRTSGGHISVDGATGDADISTAGGGIKLEEMGGFVRADTAGGDIEVSLAPGNRSGVDLSTDDGAITVAVPRGMGYEVDAVARGAWVEIDMPNVKVSGQRGKETLKGSIGSGGPMLRLRSDGYEIIIEESR